MGSLLDRDKTQERETKYPETAGNALKQLTQPIVEAHAKAATDYIDLIEQILKRDDVKFSVKMDILAMVADGKTPDPLVFGGSLPAAMMTKLEQLGVEYAEISGGMTVSENNKASNVATTAVNSVTKGGIGTPFWNVSEQLTVQHGVKSTEARETDYRSRIDWSLKMSPLGESEGIALIKECVSDAFKGVIKLNQSIVDAQLEILKAKLEEQKEKALPTKEDADDFVNGKDSNGKDDSDDDDGDGDDVQEPEEESGGDDK